MPHIGKVRPDLLQKLVYPRLGARRREVLVGPQFGVDNAIIRVGNGRVMAITTDPLSSIPALGFEDSAWLSVHLLASDITTSGFPPAYAILDFNLPPQMTDEEFKTYWISLEKEFSQLGTMIVGGHTGRFEGCDYTVIGAGTLMATGSEKKFVSSNMARVGDHLIVTKSAALASSAILSRVFPETIEKMHGSRFLRRAQRLFHRISTVHDALSLAAAGVREKGVSAMHDATEGGVLGGIYEMLTASKVGGMIQKESIPIAPEAEGICKQFGIDPYISLSEGALIASVHADKVEAALQELDRRGITASDVGETLEMKRGVRLQTMGTSSPLSYPRNDPYWNAFWRAIKLGWR